MYKLINISHLRKIIIKVIVVLISFGLSNLVYAEESSGNYNIYLKKGTFYGPGKMPDSPMPEGHIGYIKFNKPLFGETAYFNNGVDKPNIQARPKFTSIKNGLLSNGMPFNEHMDGGVVDVGMGAISLLTLVSHKGPNKGSQFYQLDKNANWNIRSDLALDPGFPEGLLIINNMKITTGLVWTPVSLQTQHNIPGGIDFAGSLPAGAPVIGRLGDYDMDGYLDGIIVGQSNIPIDHLFTPGAPVVQSRSFISDIPISNIDSAFLMLASILNYKTIWETVIAYDLNPNTDKDYLVSMLSKYSDDINHRFFLSKRLLDKIYKERPYDIEKIEILASELVEKYKIINKNYKKNIIDDIDVFFFDVGKLIESMKDSVILG